MSVLLSLAMVVSMGGGGEKQGTNPPGLPYVEPQTPIPITQTISIPSNVERWRGLVSAYFQPSDIDKALSVIECESNGDPNAKNPSSSASGLFQHLATYWPERATNAGIGPQADIFESSSNVAVAAWLVYHGGGWSHWNASKGCWG